MIVAVSMTALLVVVGMVLDFGLVRVDRQADKSAADSATLAGLHALAAASDGNTYPALGVCTAIRYLSANNMRFTGVSSGTGSWTNGTGTAVADGCTDTTLQATACVPGDNSTWVKYTWSGTFQGADLAVTIQSGYQLSSSSGWAEDALPAAQTFQDDAAQGCEQLAVIVTQNRKPGFGSLATSGDLVSSIRSVGRVKVVAGGNAPAMLLLKRTGCPVIQTGSAGGGSHVWVYGAVSSDGRTQPGTVHADTNGSGCTGGSNQNIFLGKASAGVVAFAAPLAANPSAADPSKPGLVTTYAAVLGATGGVLRDSTSNVCGSTQVGGGSSPCPGNDVGGRSRITRSLIDKRYLTTVRTAVSSANGVFSTLTSANATSNGYKVATCSTGNVTLPVGLTSSDNLYVDCPNPKSMAAVVAKTVFFNGLPAPAGVFSMPNATKVYVAGSSSTGINLGTGTFSMHTAGNLSGGKCSDATAATSTNKALLFVKDGVINASNNSLLQLCNTTVLMLGGQADGCLPAANGTAPTQTPCTSGTGTGQLKQTGGDTDWTAPNSVDVTLDANSSPTAAAVAAWTDPNGPEDLAFWSESAGNAASTTYQMNGQSSLHAVGVYMAPNADPFGIGGGACQSLTNAQYVASSLSLNGTGTCLDMRVDSYSAVQLPQTTLVGLVR